MHSFGVGRSLERKLHSTTSFERDGGRNGLTWVLEEKEESDASVLNAALHMSDSESVKVYVLRVALAA